MLKLVDKDGNTKMIINDDGSTIIIDTEIKGKEEASK